MSTENQTGSAPSGAAHVLSNGRMTTLLTPAGGGYTALDGFALTRWAPDPARDAGGFRFYVRDAEAGAFWTIAGGGAASGTQAARFHGTSAEFEAARDNLGARVTVCVDATHDAELRSLTLVNTGDRPRVIDVTTCADLSLNTPAADAAHPAFSKLFVQTAHLPDDGALLAWRRQRSPEDRPLFAAHRLLHDVQLLEPLSFETDRMRFIGRGRTAADPLAMCTRLSGCVGNVLDPMFALRAVVRLEPGESASFLSVLAADASREVVVRTLREFRDVAAGAAALSAARTTRADDAAALGLPRRWRETLRLIIGSPTTYELTPHCAQTPGMTGPATVLPQQEALSFFNGWGGFTRRGDEYVIRLPHQNGRPRRPPLPWVNVMANEEAGCIVSESGAIYTWSANSRENRVTPWFNDPVEDPHGEAHYIVDRDTGAVWSPTPGPRPGNGDYETRHGLGYSRFIHDTGGVVSTMDVFVPVDAPARIVRIELRNTGPRPRHLTLASYAQLVLGGHEADTRGIVATEQTSDGSLFAANSQRGEFSQRVAFARAAAPTDAVAFTTDRGAFMGAGGTEAPEGLRPGGLAGRTGSGFDPCFVLSCDVDLEPGEVRQVAFTLGEAADRATAERITRRFADIAEVAAALETAQRTWREHVSAVRISTPAPALDLMVNGWLTYQNLSCRMWARSAYYQSGGAFGFRDQLQDSSALLYIDPDITRSQILLHAEHQFVEGDVLHWWHPPLSKGIRTRFSDDLLWLPYITMFYVNATGDEAILDEQVGYMTARMLNDDEDEEFVVPQRSAEPGPLYGHCCRALDRSLTKGPHGLPLIGVGDWNDGMNRVGREGRGESVWLGFFIFDILRDFIPVCERRGDSARVAAYTAYRAHLEQALNDAGWDGAWYRRAYYDSGQPLGSAENDECRIDALAQAWAVLSGAAPRERAERALDAMEEHLVSEAEGIIRLLTPAFDRTPHDPGYIKGYLPGVRENGGQYTHGVLWAVRALAEARRVERAATLLEMLSPVTRGGSPENAQRYMVEPYVVAADVYGVAPHVGRGGWTWYTGSAGWMFRIALESVLGMTLHEGSEIQLAPCIPAAWPGFTLDYRRPDGTTYRFVVVRGDDGIKATMDDAPLDVSAGVRIPLVRDGAAHDIRVEWPR